MENEYTLLVLDEDNKTVLSLRHFTLVTEGIITGENCMQLLGNAFTYKVVRSDTSEAVAEGPQGKKEKTQ
jgi:hypothetical protein